MTIIDMFEQIVEKFPANYALKSESEGQLSYKELDSLSNYIANELLQITPLPQVVGVSISRSFSMIASMIGVLKAGMAYLPLDPTYPRERLDYIVNNSSVQVIVCNHETSDLFKNTNVVIIGKPCYVNEKVNVSDENSLAYILYTSGSTGLPNGVMVKHHAIMDTLTWCINYYGLSMDDSNIQLPSFSFASSVEDIFSTLLSGGTLVIINAKDLLNIRYLKHVIHKYNITHLLLVPTLYTELVPIITNTPSLRFVVIAGEKAQQSLVQKHFELLPNVALYVEYGMTETSVCCTAYRINSPSEPIYIGTIINNMNYIILDEENEDVGELLVSGKGLAEGYHNMISVTNERFVIINNIRFFKTGDYVKKTANGNLEYVGRKDHQIKVNGQRVDLSEIDHVLQSDAFVENSVTVGISLDSKNVIVSFIKTNLSDEKYFLGRISNYLPKYYIPNYFILIREFEYLPNRKVDIIAMKKKFIETIRINRIKEDDAYKKIIHLLNEISHRNIVNSEFELDIRSFALDSIEFIHFMAQFEEVFDFEFDYDEIDKMGIVSLSSLYAFVKNLKR
jgi:amino acid adenylation domain-containing protein